MTTHEERMCELQADIFESSRDRFSCGSMSFIARYMRSEVAKGFDNVDDDYNYISMEEAFIELEKNYPSLKRESDKKIAYPVLRWIGYIYRCYCIRKKISSLKLYKELKVEKLLALYDTFHTLDPDDCVDRIEEIIRQSKPQKASDYEIYRSIRLKLI